MGEARFLGATTSSGTRTGGAIDGAKGGAIDGANQSEQHERVRPVGNTNGGTFAENLWGSTEVERAEREQEQGERARAEDSERDELERLFDPEVQEAGAEPEVREVGAEPEDQELEDGVDPEEGRSPMGMTAPLAVSQAEKDEHEKTHIPFRSWCTACVRGRKRKKPHMRRSEEEKAEERQSAVPRISMDYHFMSKEDEEAKKNPMLTMVNEKTGDKYTRAVGRKGMGATNTMDWLVKDMHEELKSWGHAGGPGGRIILKCDGEAGIKAVREALGRYHGGEVVPEEPAKGESQSNGTVEEAGKTVREYVRVYKEQIEMKTGAKLSSDSTIVLWAIRWAAMALSRFQVGTDGKTAYERRKQRRCRLEVVPFGERVWYKQIRDGKDRKDKFESEERSGIWLGHARTSNEVLIGTSDGVVRAYSVSRRPEEERWSAEDISNIRGTPQQPNPNKPGGIIPVQVRFDAPEEGEETVVVDKKADVRRMRISNEMLAEHGYTEGCEGCRYKSAGLKGSRAHTEACRQRIMEAVSQSEAGFERIQNDQQRLDWRRAATGEAESNEAGPVEVEPTQEAEEAMEVDDGDEEVKALMQVIGRVDTKMVEKMWSMRDVDLVEIYSPPRVVMMAARYGLKPGESMDLTNGWDFTLQRHREAAERYIKMMKPRLVIGSPECRMFSALQNLRKWGDKAEGSSRRQGSIFDL